MHSNLRREPRSNSSPPTTAISVSPRSRPPRISDRARRWGRAAARAISVHAYDTAVLHLERASACLDEISAPAEQRFTVAALHEEVLDVLGRRDDQRHTIQQMERL